MGRCGSEVVSGPVYLEDSWRRLSGERSRPTRVAGAGLRAGVRVTFREVERLSPGNDQGLLGWGARGPGSVYLGRIVPIDISRKNASTQAQTPLHSHSDPSTTSRRVTLTPARKPAPSHPSSPNPSPESDPQEFSKCHRAKKTQVPRVDTNHCP